MAKYSGKNTKVEIAGTAFGVKSYKFKDHVDGEDVTDTESGGHRQYQEGLDMVEWSFDAEYDPSTDPMTNAPALTKGVYNGGIKLYLNRTDAGKFLNMPSVFIDDIDYDAPVDGIVKFTVSGKSNGAYTLPS